MKIIKSVKLPSSALPMTEQRIIPVRLCFKRKEGHAMGNDTIQKLQLFDRNQGLTHFPNV